MARTKPCAYCGTEFEYTRSTAKYCSDTCKSHRHLVTKKRIELPRNLRFQVLARDKFRCLWCGDEPDRKQLRVDHVVPVAQGGLRTALKNLVTACNECNAGKGDLMVDPEDYPITVLRVTDPDHPRVAEAANGEEA